jgi:hypothetical protein
MSIHEDLTRETSAAERRPDFSAPAPSTAHVDPPLALRRGTRDIPMTQQRLMLLQRCAGNHAVASVMRDADETSGGSTMEQAGTDSADADPQRFVLTEEFVTDPEVGAPDTAPQPAPAGFFDGGMVGVTPFGERTGQEDVNVPHVFSDGGQTGTIAWAGGAGAGAHGNQGVGSLQTQVVPVFKGSPGPTAGRFSSRVMPATGLVAVTRSFLGAFAGDQGNGFWLSNSAAARINQHERNHVDSSRGIHTMNLTPLENRIANAALGTDKGATGAEAVTAHRGAINWVPSINAFITADTAANKAPNGVIDTADVAAGWLQNLGPGNVLGVVFSQRVVLAGEAAPPTAAPTPPAVP